MESKKLYDYMILNKPKKLLEKYHFILTATSKGKYYFEPWLRNSNMYTPKGVKFHTLQEIDTKDNALFLRVISECFCVESSDIEVNPFVN